MAGAQIVVDLVAGTQVHADRVAGAELLLNHFTPGDGSEFTHQFVQNGTKKWKFDFSTSVPNRVRVAIPLCRVEGTVITASFLAT